MSSLLSKPTVQHHHSRVSPVQLRDFPLHQWGNLTVKGPTQHTVPLFCKWPILAIGTEEEGIVLSIRVPSISSIFYYYLLLHLHGEAGVNARERGASWDEVCNLKNKTRPAVLRSRGQHCLY